MRTYAVEGSDHVVAQRIRDLADVLRSKAWLVLLVTLLLSTRSFSSTWTHVQGTAAASSSHVTTLTVTLPSNPGVGHDLIVGVQFDCCASVPVSQVSVHDANGNWYAMSPHSPVVDPNSADTASTYFFYLLNAPSNASQTLYINWSTAIDAVAWADEFSSSSGTAAFDTDLGALNTFVGSTISAPSITPAGSDELLYALAFPGNVLAGPTAGASAGPWIGAAGGIASTTTGGDAEYDLSASSATSPNFTDTVTGDGAAVAVLAISPQPGIPTPAPSVCGELSQTGTDSNDALYPLGVPCVTGSNAGGYTPSSVSYWVGSPTSTSFDLGVYADSSGSPGALLCHASTGTITPLAGWNSVNIGGCPTLSSGTRYWVGYITGSNQIKQGTTPELCPGASLAADWAIGMVSTVSLPSSFGSFGAAGTSCYSLYMTLNPAPLSSIACGETAQSGTDSYNSQLGWGTPCVTGSNSGGYTVSSVSYWVGSPTSTSFDLGVYGDSSGNPGTLLCHASTGTITPSAGWNSISISGCPTLSASTPYWVGYVNGNNQIVQGTISGVCPGTSNFSVYSSTTLPGVSLASPFGANIATNSCYSIYMTLSTGSSLPTPTLTISSSANPTSYSQPVSFTATMSSGPTGLVTFFSDGVEIGQALLNGTTATFTTSGLSLGSHSIIASWAGNATYQSVSSSSISQTINQGTPTITWTTPAPLPYSRPLGATQLNATANTPGTFVYTPPAGSLFPPGTQTLSVTFTPTDTTDYSATTATVALSVPFVPPSGIITSVAGGNYPGAFAGDSGLSIAASLNHPEGLAVDQAGNVYVADTYNEVVRKISASTGIITTFAGNGTFGYSGDGGPATSAELATPTDVAVDTAGNVYIADHANNVIRKVAASTGTITIVAGQPNADSVYSGDGGPATSAAMYQPTGMVLDAAGNMYIADTLNSVVRKVTASTGIITTVAGNHTGGYSGDGGPATSAMLSSPEAVALDGAGNLYILDFDDKVIRKVASGTGIITTVVGNGTEGYSGDGGPATSAEINPCFGGLAVDAAGNIYLADTDNNVVRFVSASTGIIGTIVGTGTANSLGNGGPATSAQIDDPWGLNIDSAGNIYIGETGNNAVRVVGSLSTQQVTVSVSPSSATLYGGQTQTFTATVNNASNTAVTWSISPSNLGTITSTGLYSAPSSIATQQTVTVTATSQADATKSASATVTLAPSIVVSVTPSTVSLYGGQAQSFLATVTNASNGAVTWSISPAGIGSIDTSGNYAAPTTIAIQQVVTVTATSQADATKAATATIYLLPPCVSNGYSYVRSIVIDHSKVSKSDQTNFPFLFSTTDPAFKSIANGGHVTNSSGYDIIFSTDPAGSTKLDSEFEEYNPATGQVAAWVRIPTLSHAEDTVLYVFYGNANITSSQSNPSGVWSNGYSGVWHLVSGNSGVSADSTNNQNGTNVNTTAVAGPIAGTATGFNGSTSYVAVPGGGGLSGASQGTISMWVQWTGTSQPEGYAGAHGAIVGRQRDSYYSNDILSMTGPDPSTATLQWQNPATGFTFLTGVTPVGTGWDLVEVTFGPNGQMLYLNGGLEAKTLSQVTLNADQGIPLTIGAWVDGGGSYLNGAVEEAHVSTVPRSSDWIATEYNNQSSPSTFYSLNPEMTLGVVPITARLYASQTQQFSVPFGCSAPAIWSMPAGSPGFLSGDGLYTAPGAISAPQRVTITATNSADPTENGFAVVTLLPPPQNPTMKLVAAAQPPYVVGTTQQFKTTLTNQDGSPLVGASVAVQVTGSNSTSLNGTTDADGEFSFSYSGSHNGTDTLQASSILDGETIASNSLLATWITPVQGVSTSTVTGEFFITDGSGAFDVSPTAVPVFTESFPTINFNPPAGTIPGNTSGVGDGTRPFTDVTTDFNGNYTGTIVAQGNGYQAGVNNSSGNMFAFQAVFRGTFTVANPGQVTFDFFTDDGFILGVANGATRVSGANYNIPFVTPFSQYPVMGGFNSGNSASGNQVIVNFPAAGTYPYEVDYTECCGGPLVLTMTQGATNPTGVAPTGSLTLSPATLQPLQAGGQQTFDVFASDAGGNPVPNLGVGLVIGGVDTLELTGTTDSTGHASIVYKDVNPGTATAQAVSVLSGMVTYSNVVSVPWTLPPAPVSGSGSSGSLNVSISAQNMIVLPSTLAVSGTVTDSALPQGDTITTTWSQVGGAGTVTFASPHALSTTASFNQAGSYTLQLGASDVNGSTLAQITVNVEATPGVNQGWIGSPAYGSQVSCMVPVTVAPGTTLQSGVLAFYPADDLSNVTILNANTTGAGQIGLLDTTALNNGTYWIALQATDTNNNSEFNLSLVTVVGNCKPGRITSTVTDLVVPAKGLAINIQRTYDTLNASTVGDFGYGWNLSTNVNLTVDPKGDVSFTLGGIRHTFYLTPVFNGFLPFYTPAYTADPGFHGTLSPNGAGCSDFFSFIVPDGSLWYCIDGGQFTPSGYVYTDPNGTQYLMSSSGQLQLIEDKNGNALTITRNGITSSTGLNVPFVRDTTGRITEITDPQGNHYQYSYDSDGNLASVTYPNVSQPSTYTYDTHHRYLSGTDFRGNALPTTAYYGPSDTDANGLPLNGRLKSVTDALSETTSYAYDLSTNTTTITYPPDANGNVGTATTVSDTFGNVLVSTDPLGHTTTNAYDASENLLSTTDPLGHVTRNTYDTNGNKTSTTYPATATSTNTTSTTTYNQYSEPTQTADELGNTRSFNYDVNFNPQSVTDGLGTLASFAFNTDGTMQSGAVGYDIGSQPSMGSQFVYDPNGNLASRTDALGRTTSYTYDPLGHKLTMTEPLPNSNTSTAAATTTYTYDDFGNLTQTAAPLGRSTSSTFDGNSNKISDADARGNQTTYQYDSLNRLILTTYPDTTTASKTYDFRGNVITETDPAGHVTKHVYDLAGRESSVTHAYGTSSATTTSYTYDNAGRKLTETDALGHTTTYSYDAAGNLTGVSGVGGSFTYAYDNARNRVSMTDGNGHTTGYQYDSRKRLVETDYPDGTKKTNAYDGPGNLVSVTDQAEKVVDYTYDAANQLKTVVQANSPNSGAETTIVGYDADGNPIVLQDANLHVTASTFDLVNELTGKTLPDGSLTESRTYDNNGNLATVTHFNGVVTTYTYDTLNRLLSRATPSETTVTFTYTGTGKRHTMTDASGTTTYSYDAMDQLTQKATPEGTLTYTYDSAGNLASMTSNHTNGVSVAYTYDSLNRLSTVVDNRLSGSNTTTYTYDDASNVATATYPNNVQSTFTYDDLNRVTGLSSQLGNYTYQLGPAGNRTSALEPSGRSITWSYDGIYRLTNEAITGAPSGKNGSISYGLDPVGNRTSASSFISGLAPVSGTFNSDDELASETCDQNGNVLSEGGKTFTYDAENHLMSMGTTVGLMYDGDGNRVAKSVNGTSTYYLVDNLNPIGYPQVVEELSGTGAVTRQYTYGLQLISQQQAISNTWTPSFYGYDSGGSVRALTNVAGAVTDIYEYDAFGNEISSTGSTPNVYMYRGEAFDSDLGLYYLRARWMNPLTGRFMSRDPRNGYVDRPPTLHKYLYAGGDPVNLFDPTGQATVTKPGGVLGEAAAEYAGILQNISIRVFVISQVTVPIYLKSEQGKAAQLLFLTGVSVAAAYSCEFAEAAETIRDVFESLMDPEPSVRGPGLNCNTQTDPRPGGAGEGDGSDE